MVKKNPGLLAHLAEIPSQREGFLFSLVCLSFQEVLPPPPFEIRYFQTLEIQGEKIDFILLWWGRKLLMCWGHSLSWAPSVSLIKRILALSAQSLGFWYRIEAMGKTDTQLDEWGNGVYIGKDKIIQEGKKKNRLKERVDRGRMESRKTWVMEKIWTGS